MMMLAMMTSTWLTTLSTPTQPNLSMVYRCCIDVVLNIRGSVSEITGGKKCDFPAEKRIFLPPFISSSIAKLYYYLCLFFFLYRDDKLGGGDASMKHPIKKFLSACARSKIFLWPTQLNCVE